MWLMLFHLYHQSHSYMLDFSAIATEQWMDGEMDAYRKTITWLQLDNSQFRLKQDFFLDTSLGDTEIFMLGNSLTCSSQV